MNRPLSHQGWAPAPDQAQPPPDVFAPGVIHSQLERILASPQFRDSLRLTRFLSFVVSTALSGKSECIKAYTIATEALGRGNDFDPQNDPIVRVEAGRLRQALARYYAKDGRDDPVLIDLPRGGSVPNFQRRADPAAQIAGGDPLREAAGAGSGSLTPHHGDLDQINRQVIETIQLAKAHCGQGAEFSAVLRRVRQTLDESYDLLKSTASIGATGELPASEALAGPADANSPGDPGFTLLPSRPPQPGRAQPASPLQQIRDRIAALTSRAGAKARIFQIAFAAIAVLAILEVVFDIDHPLVGGPNHGPWYKLWPATHAAALPAPGGEGAPTIYVEPVTIVGQPVEGLFPAKIIRERLNSALARYDDVTIVTLDPGVVASSGAASTQRPPSIYRLAATVRYGDDVASLIVQLVDTADSSVAWSRQYDRLVKPHTRRSNNTIAPDVARSLLDPFGVIQARERVKRAYADPMTDTYRCILDANVYLRSFDPSQYRPVRDCLVGASERTPPDATVFADLAFVYLRNYRFGIGAPAGDPTTLDNAYATAARAVEIKPESAFAQYALGATLLAKGDIARAKIASDKSYRLSPENGAVAFGRATMLVLTGDVDAGLALLDSNAARQPNNWIGYHLVKALGCYLKGDITTATIESRQIVSPFFPPGLMLDALIADKAGDRARAQQDIAMLYQFYPAWRQNFRASIGRYLPESGMADRVAADFKAAAADTEQ